MDFALIELILRIVGRAGFLMLLIGAYRLWRMPILKKHSRQIFWLITLVCTLSLIFSAAIYYIEAFDTPVWNLILLMFNVLSTWFLALFMNYRAHAIKKLVGSEKIEEYSAEIDRQIAKIKGTPTPE